MSSERPAQERVETDNQALQREYKSVTVVTGTIAGADAATTDTAARADTAERAGAAGRVGQHPPLDPSSDTGARAAPSVADPFPVAAFDAVGDAVVVVDRARRLAYVNAAAAARIGRTREELVGHDVAELFASSAGGAGNVYLQQLVRAAAANGDHVSEFADTPSDAWLQLRSWSTPDGIVAIATDATEHRRAHAALERSELRARALVSACADATWTWNPTTGDGNFAETETWWKRLSGQSPDEQRRGEIGWLGALHADDRRRVHAAWERSMATGLPFHAEYRVDTVDGGLHHVVSRAVPVRNDDGSVHEWVGMVSDVTEQRLADETLRASEERFRAIVGQATVGICQTDLGGHFVLANRKYCEIVGYDPVELMTLTKQAVTHPDDRARDAALFEGAVRNGTDYVIEKRYLRKDGSSVWVNTSVFALRDRSGHPIGVLAVALDITDWKRAEQSVRDHADRLSLALAASNLGDWSWDTATDALRLSPRAMQIFGVAEHDVLTWSRISELLHPDDRERVRAAVDHAVSEGGQYDVEYRVVRPDGRTVWVAALGRAYRDGTSRASGMIGVVGDITERKCAEHALRRSEQRFRRLFDANLIAVAYATGDGRFTDANDEFLRMVGYSRAQLEAGELDFALMTPPDFREITEQRMAECLQRGACTPFEKEYLRSDGTRVPILIGFALLDESADQVDPAQRHLVGFMLDLTERRRLETALTAKVAELAEADRRKDEFLATLAHELRNPLAPIRNGMQLLGLAGDDRAVTERAREVMERQLAHMVRLVDDLLDLSRISRGRIELRREWVDLGRVVESAVEAARPAIEARGHSLQVDLPSTPLLLDADQTRLAQVFANLLDNAAKYTDPGGHIVIGVERAGDDVVIRVRDDGIGIRAEMLPRVFEMFTQAGRPSDRAPGGLGIGLTLVKRLVEMHDGTIEARSAGEGRGSEFVVRLPGAVAVSRPPRRSMRPSDPAPRPSRRDAATRQSRRIIVCDDNQDAAESLALLLQLDGHDVQTAYDGLEATALAQRFLPEVMFVDIGMPRLDGHGVARHVRAMPGGQEIVLVALTGWGQDQDRSRSRQAGFDVHLVKPVDPATLHRLLERVDRRRCASALDQKRVRISRSAMPAKPSTSRAVRR